jgi:DNA-binding response OmpR family regulator
MPETILVVEDEPALLETLAYNLTCSSYQVYTATNGQSAIHKARQINPDLIVLDIMPPVMDGFEVCRILMQEMKIPLLVLTTHDDANDRAAGFEIGADDYLTKPFSMREFLARVKAQLRRARFMREEINAEGVLPREMIRLDNLILDLTRREVLLDDQPLALKPKDFDLLLFLARHKCQVLSREMLLEKVWGWKFSGGSRTVDVHIRWLREKIEANPAEPIRIVTVRGAGYRFEG